MHVDRRSLVELGVLPSANGRWPLAALFGATHTAPSADALRRVLQEPLPSVEAIASRQRLLRVLAPLRAQIPWASLCALAQQVQAYLTSNYVVVPRGLGNAARFALTHRDIVRHVAQQVRATALFVEQAEQVHSLLCQLPHDVITTELLEAFEAVVQHASRERLRPLARARDVGDLSLARCDGLLRAMPSRDATAPRSMHGALSVLVQAVWQLDAWCALAQASAQLVSQGGSWPTVDARGEASLQVEGVRHPMLPAGVANDVALATHERVLFLTGPNMAGKSTVLRALGLVVYLAHCGLAVPAARAVVPWCDRLFVAIDTHDDLSRGESLYLAEVRRVGAVVQAVTRGERVFAVLDEAFRGTNVVDASEAMGLLVDGLASAAHGTFVIASHLADVGASRVTHAGVSCWCMAVAMHEEGPVFPYRLERGVSAVHLGMVLLDREGVGPALRALVGARAGVV